MKDHRLYLRDIFAAMVAVQEVIGARTGEAAVVDTLH